MKKPRKFFRRPIVIIIILLILIGGGYLIFSRSEEVDYEFTIVQKGDIIQEVSVTGRVRPVQDVDLAFENSGRVSEIFVEIGDSVVVGQKLIQLENAELLAQLAQVEADLKTEEAELEELKLGTREEDIKVKEAELKKNEEDLLNYYNSVPIKINDAYVKSNDAVRIKTAGIFSGYKTSSYTLTYTACDIEAENNSTSLRLLSEAQLDQWVVEINELNEESSQAKLNQALINAQNHLKVFKNFLDATNSTLTTGCTINDSNLDTYRTNISTAKTNIITALNNIIDLQNSIASQKLTVNKIQEELNLKLAGTIPEQIVAQEAQVEKAEASVLNYQAQIAKTVINSPIAGVVTKQEAKVGEIIGANTSVVSIISAANFEIEANVPEADIAKIKIGNSAKVTLDAYGDDVEFEAMVVKIDPAETVIEGVATYKTTFQFVNDDERIKSGMTANIDIMADKRENVIVVPQRAVISKDGNKMVRLVKGEEIVEVKVSTGLRGSYGDIEIVKGVKEGDKVITLLK